MTHRDEDEEIIDSALDTLAWQRREIDRLKAEIERLRGALEPFARAQRIVASVDEGRIRCVLTYPPGATHTFTLASLDAARAALGEKQ